MIRPAAVVVLALTLAACGRSDPEPEPAPSVSESAVPEAQATNSIFDPDAEVESQDAMLEPLVATIGFAKGGAEISDTAADELAALMASEQMAKGGPVIIRGHSDAGGTDAVNQRVSSERAEAVRDYLADQGVAPKRMTVIAFGAQNPVQPNAKPDGTPNEEGRAANRRVEVTIDLPVKPKPAGKPSGKAAGTKPRPQ